jgi:fatty acid desaturase
MIRLYLKSIVLAAAVLWLTWNHACGNLWASAVLPWISFMFAACAMHDAGHGVGHGFWRQWVLIFSACVGMAGTPRWIQKHNAHHAHTNTKSDPELSVHPWLKPPTTVSRLLLVYSCLHLSLMADHLSLQPTVVRGVKIRRTRGLWVDVLEIMAYILIRFWLPMYLGGGVTAIVAEIVFGFPASLFIALVFQVSHSFDGAKHNSDDVEETTCDFSRESWIFTELFGALNHQVEHHRDPMKPHTELHEGAPPRHTFPTFVDAVASHLRYMTSHQSQ